ncbi:MAG: integrase core domain-containing protein, partial [Gammaproteobacteria bacterium]
MVNWLKILVGTLRSGFRPRRELVLENLALRQQLEVFKHRYPHPRLKDTDRFFWILSRRVWSNWRCALHVVQPATVVRWHRQGFKYYWRWKSRGLGRPKLDPEIRARIRRMCLSNPTWGAPRIHGELLKLGFELSEAVVSKYMIRRPGPPSQTWRAFLHNHMNELISLDVFTVPTATFRILFVFVVLSHDRRHIRHFDVAAHPTAIWTARQLVEACGTDKTSKYLIRDRDAIYGNYFQRQAKALGIDEVITAPVSPWQNAYAERVIGSIRRECLDHKIILGERHLKRVLSNYVHYYHNARTHLFLGKDTPDGRAIQSPEQGTVVELP